MSSFTVLRKAFDGFDHNRSGSIPCDFVADILRMMGQPFNKKILEELIEEVDADSKHSFLFIEYNNMVYNMKICYSNYIWFSNRKRKQNTYNEAYITQE